jgi:glycosyltransferase involved in cell wall biosynthesis
MQKTTFPVEYIIGEDYSADETRSIVFEYAEKYPDRIRVITADYNVGSKANGRRCVRACRGKYMAICEGDDYWIDPYKLQKQVEFLEKNPEYGMCYAKVRVYIQRQERYLIRAFGGKAITFDELIKKNTIPTPTVCLKKNLYLQYLKEIKPESKNWLLGDYPLWLWFAHNSKVYFLNEVTGVYRVLKESSSHSRNMENEMRFGVSSVDVQRYFMSLYSHKEIDFFAEELSIKASIAASHNQYGYYKMYISKMQIKNFKMFIKKVIAKSFLLFNLYHFYIKMKR